MIDLHLVVPGFEEPLARETDGTVAGPGLVSATRGAGGDPIFALQALPDATEVRAPSVATLANGAFEAILPFLDGREEAWTLHVLATGEHRARADLVGEALLDVARRRRRRVHRRHAQKGPAPLLVQVLLADRERLFTSACAPVRLARGGWWPVPFPGGIAPVPEDRAAPSRAYRKLGEALLWMERSIGAGETVADLGAAPGGWTWAALRAGAARVHAVDRAELDPAFAEDPRVVHHRRTAFGWEPPDPPVDWLLCDVIAYPEASVGLLRRWVEEGWARNLVFHVKFKGREDYGPALQARDLLLAAPFPHVRAKHLSNDRNEVTLMAGGRP